MVMVKMYFKGSFSWNLCIIRFYRQIEAVTRFLRNRKVSAASAFCSFPSSVHRVPYQTKRFTSL